MNENETVNFDNEFLKLKNYDA